ncbi:MAG: hypothetical protein CVU39_25320 [Chloroflexi bacterium HGW-Chloroflexi-10]|nr:MAG: hypothetical protein CVU39_25320 [Chloroflexi bacterium HGW-Chloroflexi-10]
MEKVDHSIHQSIDRDQLNAIVRRSLRRESFEIQDWQMNQLGGGIGNPVSVGLYRFQGSGQEHGEQVNWSVILKILQSPANLGLVNMGGSDDQTHWNYWKRELLIYQSGLLNSLPDGLVAPRCYEAIELPGNIGMLWLEDISDSSNGAWSLERYALTARHLGRFNGIYSSEATIPSYPWFGMQRNRNWVNLIDHWKTIPWENPRVLQRYPRPEANSFRRMLLENERFLATLDLLPKTICHGDTYPTNFISRRLSDGQEQTVALDWALMGVEPLGDDLGQLVFGAQMNLKGTAQDEITEVLFEYYVEGLRDSGCRVDPQQVRFGFTASAALRVGLFQVLQLGEALKHSDMIVKNYTEHINVSNCFEVTMANEAYTLLSDFSA